MGRFKKTRIFLLNDGRKVISSEIQELDCLNLPHPKGGVPVMFLHFEGDFYDIQSAEPSKYGSWFVDQRVSSDNKIYLASKFDARFLVLPYLEKTAAQPKFSPLDQVVIHSGNCHRIPLAKLSSWGMEEMCDVKDLGDDMVFYRYNEQKMLLWLGAKVAKTAVVLAAQRKGHADREHTAFVGGFNAGSTNSAAATAASNKAEEAHVVESKSADSNSAAVNAEDMRIAVQILTDYLSDATASKLVASHGYTATDMQVSKKQDTLKRKTDWELEMELEAETLVYAMPTASADVPVKPAVSGISTMSGAPAAGSKKPAARPNAASKFNGGKPVEAKKSIASFFAPPK